MAETEKLVLENLDFNKSVSKIANELGFTTEQVLYVMRRHNLEAVDKKPKPKIKIGPPKLEPYAIAVSPGFWQWDPEYHEAIYEARRKYDAGTHEMFQLKVDGQYVLYLIPRLNPTEPRKYFYND